VNMAPPMPLQQRYWNQWNASTREAHLDEVSFRQAEVVREWLKQLGSKDLEILEVGCGACWFCEELSQFGQVTGTDLSDEVLSRAQKRMPQVKLVSGDFMQLDFGPENFDLIVCLEVLSCVEDQPAFIEKIAYHLRPNGYLMLATPNRFVLQRFNRIPPPGPGQVRRWTDKRETSSLLQKHFNVLEIFSVTPRANKGLLRIIHSRTFNRPIRALFGNRFDRFKESLGLGWTLMALARKTPVR
jgi:2-polyprenyl-3-methyl-5-hydroxy-6-metoxy-1,4-benzoquinol methylase